MYKTSGERLKQKLHLKNFRYAKIRRLITPGGTKTYQIVFNSRLPKLPLTTFMLNSKKLMPSVVDGNSKKYSAIPWQDLNQFDGLLNPAIFFVSDLAGFYGKENNYSEKYVSIDSKKRLTEITLVDLRKVDAYTSDTTQKFKDLRQQYQGQGIKNTKLVGSKVIEATGDLQFQFLTESTEIGGKGVSHKVGTDTKQQYSKEADSLIDNPSKTYEMIIQLNNVFPNKKQMSWLEVYDGELIDKRMIKELLDVADIEIWDNTPAFQYQGFNYRLSQLDASLFPETRPDSQWGKIHGSRGLLDKHFSQLLNRGTIELFLNQMLSILVKESKKRGYATLQKGKGNYSINTKKENK